MDSKLRKSIESRVHKHTVCAMIDCANMGHGCDHARALKSARRLIEFFEDMLEYETLKAHSAGYSKGFKAGKAL